MNANRTYRGIVLAFVAAAAVGVAAAQEAATPLTLIVGNDGIEAPETLEAGFYVYEIVNDSDHEETGLEVARLNEGVTAEEVLRANAAVGAAYGGDGNPGEAVRDLASLVTPVGGESLPAATVELTPGTYLVSSFADPALWTTFTVTEGDAASAPAADLTVDMMDFAFSFPAELPAGPQTWEVRNVGEQVHHLVLLRVADDATVDDVMAYLESEQDGPPPGEEAAYVAVLGADAANFVDVDLEPGTYVAVCFLPDYDTGMPHVALGMVADFTVPAGE